MLLFHVHLSIKIALDLFRCYGGALIVYSSIYYKGMYIYVRHNIVQRIQAVEICFYQCVYAYVHVIDIGLMRNANLKDLYKYMTV